MSRVDRVVLPMPEFSVPSSTLVLPVAGDRARRSAALVREWIAERPELRPYCAELVEAAEALVDPSTPDEPGAEAVAAFLLAHTVQAELVVGGSVLTLEGSAVDSDPVRDRIGTLLRELHLAADRPGQLLLVTELDRRTTTRGLKAARTRWLAVSDAFGDRDDAPLVESCRWFYPVPGHPGLTWSLILQTLDLDAADLLIDEFDLIASSLHWSDASIDAADPE